MSDSAANSTKAVLKKRPSISVGAFLPALSNPECSSPPAAAVIISPIDEQFISQITVGQTPLEQSLANVLKAIYAAGRAEAFQDVLGRWAQSREGDIERVCMEGYGRFVPTVDALMGSVRAEQKDLLQKMERLHEELFSSAQALRDTRLERFEARKLLLNVGLGVRKAEDCLMVLELLQRIKLEIADANYQVASRLLDDLQDPSGQGSKEKVGLHSIADLPIYEQVKGTVAILNNRLWDAAMGKVKAWLGKIRDDSSVMGRLALSQVQTRYEQFERQASEMNLQADTDSFDVYLLGWAAEDMTLITANDLVRIDFSPLQDALRLASMMNRAEDFEQLVLDTRRVQAELLIQGTRVVLEQPDNDPRSLRSFLAAVSGFFIFERALTRLPASFYPEAQVEKHWETALKRLSALALESLRLSSSDRSSFMKLKWQFIFFGHVSGALLMLPTSTLQEAIMTLFYRYVDLLRGELAEALDLAVAKDSLTPVSFSPDLLRLLPRYLENRKDAEMMTLPFSQSVIECFTLIRSFSTSFGVFLEGVPGSSQRRPDFTAFGRRTVDLQLLTRLAKAYERRLHDDTVRDVAHRLQILKNLETWSELCSVGGDLVQVQPGSEECRTVEERLKLPALDAVSAFKTALKLGKAGVLSSVDDSVDEILDKLTYDRNPRSPPTSPSAAMIELIRFLGGLKMTLNDGLGFVWVSLLGHIADFYDARIFMDVKYPHCNVLFFRYISTDLEHLRSFVQGLAGSSSDQLSGSLASPLEMCSLMAAESVHEYLDPVIRNRKYPHLESHRLVSVLGRLREPDDKRRSVEDLILLLK